MGVVGTTLGLADLDVWYRFFWRRPLLMEDTEDNGERTRADSSKDEPYDPDSEEGAVGTASSVKKPARVAEDGEGCRECLDILLEDVVRSE